MRILFEFNTLNNFANERDRYKDWRRVITTIEDAKMYVIEPLALQSVDYVPKSSWM